MKVSHAIILFIMLSASIAAIYYFKPLSLIPGYEGLDIRFYGFNPYSQCESKWCVYSVNSSQIDPPWYWVDRSPYTAIFGAKTEHTYCKYLKVFMLGQYFHLCVADESWEVKVNVGTPMKVSEDRAFTYWVNESGRAVKVVAWREVYEVPVEIVSVPKKDYFNTPYGNEELWYAGAAKGVRLWFALGTVVWNRAMTDPDNPAVHAINAFNVPVAVYVESSTVNAWERKGADIQGGEASPAGYIPTEAWNFVVTSADASGRRIPLYTEPSEQANVLQFTDSPDSVKSYVQNDPRPDTRFKPVVFFPITLVQFGAYYKYDCGWGYCKVYLWYPAKTIKLRIIYFRFGEFVYTAQKDKDVIPTWKTETPHYAQDEVTVKNPFQLPSLGFGKYDGVVYAVIIGLALLFLVLLMLVILSGRVRPVGMLIQR